MPTRRNSHQTWYHIAKAPRAMLLLRPGGEAVVYGSGSREFTLQFFPLTSRGLSLHFFIVYHLTNDDRARAEATLAKLLTEQRLVHNIARRLPLSEIVAAHELVESGQAAGNVVVQVI